MALGSPLTGTFPSSEGMAIALLCIYLVVSRRDEAAPGVLVLLLVKELP